MPKTEDDCGIKWTGDVLQGNLSTNEAFALDRLAAFTHSSRHIDPKITEMAMIYAFNHRHGR